MSREKYLLGATKDNELVFGQFDINVRNGYRQFTASFNTVRPFNGENFDLEDYFEGWKDEFGKDELYDMCERFDCKPSELAENLASECCDVRDALDCSLYPECYDIDGESWYFESSSCGQYDTRNQMEEIINPDAYNLLHELWDNYHLKEVNDIVCVKVIALIQMLKKVDEEAWITDYIQRHKEELE